MLINKKHGREVFLRNRQLHYDFRKYFAPGQARFLCTIDIILAVYGILASFFCGRLLGIDIHHAHIEYGLLGVEGALFALITGAFFVKKLFRSSFSRERFLECMTIITALFYLAWGFLMMTYSIIEERETNYLPVLMIYAVCAVFTYISLQHYVVLFVFCLAGAFCSLWIFKTTPIDAALLFNVIIFGFILLATGMGRYNSAQKRFIARRDADSLREELEANNEELIAINDNLVTTTDRLKDAMERQRLFTASMNHELRSPLNGILGILQIVRDDESLSEENRSNIATAISSSKTLLQIVNDLLDFSKMEAGEFTVTKEKFNLKSVVTNIEATMKPQADAKGIDFSSTISDDTPAEMFGDSVRISQIIANIVSNGIKYTQEGFVKLEVAVSDADELKVVVSDSGQGIAEDAIEDLFVPFKRLNEQNNKKIQGTGLGLNIVKNLVEAMQGNISVESEVGKGSVFTVVIPMTDINREKTFGNDTEKSAPEIVRAAVDLSGKRILCVDDNKVNLAVFRGMFKGTNAMIDTLSGGAAAVESLRTTKYDAVFLDHMMPEMDGLDVFNEHKRTKDINEDTPFVMLTGNVTPESEKEYLSLGLTAFLSKPIIKEELFDTIEKLI